MIDGDNRDYHVIYFTTETSSGHHPLGWLR